MKYFVLNALGSYLLKAFFIIIVLLPASAPFPCRAQSSEYIIKAGFLEKFARFTDWPELSGMDDPETPFVISVIGDNPFGKSLEDFYADDTIHNKPVEIHYISSIEEIDGTHLLFISGSEKDHLETMLDAIRTLPILVIGDTEGFAAAGVHINLYITSRETLHFEINPGAVKAAGLSVQIVLLEIAKIVSN
jgi:hypothetical protein